VRIAFLVHGGLAALTGGTIYNRLLVEHLRRAGHAVGVIPLPPRPYLRRLAGNLSPGLEPRVAGRNWDLLLQDEWCHPSLLTFNARWRRSLRRGPLVALVHQVLCDEPRAAWGNRLLALAERRYLDSVDAFVLNSPATQRTVQRLSPRPRPFVVAPPGGDRLAGRPTPEEIRCRALGAGPLRLLFLGNVIPRKGLLPTIEALGRVPQPLWRLEVVGSLTMDRAHVRRVQQRVRAGGLAEQIAFRGPLAGRELASALTRADLLCMPFAYEGFGMATLEAQAFGLPVLGSAAGATSDLVRHGDNGLLVEAGDRQALAAALQVLHGDRGRLAAMSAAARRNFDTHPAWEETLARSARFLETLAARGIERRGVGHG
jgi:glycosyltransferase involved in cell wall biosynthesis